MAKKYARWAEVKARKLTADEREKITREARAELLELDLRQIRETLGKTQVELAEALEVAQSQVSRIENGTDHLLSTVQQYVRALGGEVEIVANFGDKSVKIRALG